MAAACWRGAWTLLRRRSIGGGDNLIGVPSSDAAALQEAARTWSAPAPSPSYLLRDEELGLGQEQPPQKKKVKEIPPELLEEMQQWRAGLVKLQEEEARKARLPRAGAEPPPPDGPLDNLTITERGTGAAPEQGCTIRVAYLAALKSDERVLDMQSDLEYALGSGPRGLGEVSSGALDKILPQLRKGQVAWVDCTVGDLFPPGSPVLAEHPPDAPAVCEVKILAISTTKDCSPAGCAGDVLKTVVREGVGQWCDNPTDEGSALLRVEAVQSASGARLFPREDGGKPLSVRVTVGDGKVCDALEWALLDMRQNETALVTCRSSSLCTDGLPLRGTAPEGEGPVTLKVTLLDYTKGPDAWDFDEEDRLSFALRRQAVASRLVAEGRFRLAHQRYSQICEFFHHMDAPKVRDRFLGRRELWQQCRALRIACRLELAACSLRLGDPAAAGEACDAVLAQEPENVRALHRRGEAHLQQGEYKRASGDARRLLDILRARNGADCGAGDGDGAIADAAKALLGESTKLRRESDRKSREAFTFTRTFTGMDDLRSIKSDYMDAPTDAPGTEGAPIAARWSAERLRAIRSN